MTLDRGIVFVLVAVAGCVIVSLVVRSLRNPITQVSNEFAVRAPLVETERALAELLGTARRVDVRMLATSTYEVSYWQYPGWTICVAVFAFPLGLVVPFLARERLALTVTVNPDPEGTRIRVFGRVHLKLAEVVGRAFLLRFRSAV